MYWVFVGIHGSRTASWLSFWTSKGPVTSMVYSWTKCGMAVDTKIRSTNRSTRSCNLWFPAAIQTSRWERISMFRPKCVVSNIIDAVWKNISHKHLERSVVFTCEMKLLYYLYKFVVSGWCLADITVMAMAVCEILNPTFRTLICTFFYKNPDFSYQYKS